MKLFLHNAISVTLATLMLFVTMSFTVDMHYCGDTLVHYSLTQKAHTCGMEEMQTENCRMEISKKSCCTDKHVVIEGQDDPKISIDKLTTAQHVFVASFYYSYINPVKNTDKNILLVRNYKPPILKRDIYKLHETYII